MKYSREVKIAFIFISGLFVLIWGFNFLKGHNLFSDQRVFYALYNRVDGLETGNPVTINGLKVGAVTDIRFKPDGSGKIIVKMRVDGDVKIPKPSVAKISSLDLLGSKCIAIELRNHYQMAQSGDTLKADTQESLSDEVNRQIAPIKKKAETLLATTDSILTSINYVFNKNTRDNLASSFASIERTLRTIEHSTNAFDTLLAGQQDRLQNIIGNVESISHNFKNNNEKLSKIFSNLSLISDSLVRSNFATTIRRAGVVVNEAAGIMEKINKGKGSVGLLINNDSLYNGLAASSVSLDKLIKDINENPKRYVHFSLFGGGSKKKDKSKSK